VFPAFIIREVLLRKTPLQRGGWLYFIIISIVLAVAAFWELLEWWVALLVASDVGTAFLGSQGEFGMHSGICFLPSSAQWLCYRSCPGCTIDLWIAYPGEAE
jgi:hypothetical protein